MRKKSTRNISLKILSLLLAGLLWIVIVNVEDPAITKIFEDIPVTKTNENVLKSKDQVYEVVSGNTIDVKVKGKRTIIQSLKTSDFQAVADFSKLSVVDAVSIDVSIPKYNNQTEIIYEESFMMKVSLEKLITAQIRIDVVELGTVAEGYYVAEKTPRPNMITVSGAESVINNIKDVVVEVSVNNASESFKKATIPKVYDNNGTLMDSSKIAFNYEEVEVAVNLLKTKTVNLFIELEGTPYPGYEYVNFEYEPKQVVIAGKQEDLDKVPYIKGKYNINNLREDIADEVDISLLIKEKVILIDEKQSAAINVFIKKLDSKDINFDKSEIEIRSLPVGMDASISINTPIQVKVYANKDTLATLNKSTIKPYIDLTDSQIGTKQVKIQFDMSEDDIIMPNLSINVLLSSTVE